MGVEFYLHFERELSGDRFGSMKDPKAFAFAIQNLCILAREIEIKPLDYFLFPPQSGDTFEFEVNGVKFTYPPADQSMVYSESKWVPASLGLSTVTKLLAALKQRKNKHFEKQVVEDLKLIECKLKLAEIQKIGFRFDVI
jgi:hypothetical protein